VIIVAKVTPNRIGPILRDGSIRRGEALVILKRASGGGGGKERRQAAPH